jgi:prephenate dehydrogenase
MFKRVAVFGLGLLGGSICKGLKKVDSGIHITAYGRDSGRLKPALKDKYVDETRGYDDISLSGIDLAVVAMPIGASIGVIKQLLDHTELRDDALIIDVGSVKEKIITSIQEYANAGQFIGCHPMAGSEKMGYEFSQDDLFRGASVIITPHRGNRDDGITAVRGLWESLGSKAVIISPREHDLLVTYTSHLPHMMAGSLVSLLSNVGRKQTSSADIRSFIGRGFMDVTRISSGSPDMWRDIILFNKKNILDAMSLIIDELMRLRDAVSASEEKTGRLHDYFLKVKKIRDMLK